MKNQKIYFLLFLLLYFFNTKITAQTYKIEGIVIDSVTNQPLPFVNIIYNKNKEGFISNIDGGFDIENAEKVDFLQFSYLGYENKFLGKKILERNKKLVVKLKPKVFDIDEITVFAKENPAHRIIKKVVENSNLNKPENLEFYSYTAYNKSVFTFNLDEALQEAEEKKQNIDSILLDSSYIKARKIIDSLYFFMMESISERKFKKPDKLNEKIIASKVSGLKNTSFFMLATQIQSLSFYDEMITIANSRYVNPISKGSTNRYFFNIEDTTFTERGDSIFIISYKPKRGKNFEGLEGVLSINTFNYAIQNVIAKPIDNEGFISAEIHQKYELIDNKYWFPSELNTKMILLNLVAQAGSLPLKMNWLSKSYIYNIKINEEIDKKEFSLAQLEIDKNANNKDSIFWNANRHQLLDKKENNTYHLIDSIGKNENLDLKVKLMQNLGKGYFPISVIDLNLSQLISTNPFEKFRLGVGFKTNDKISSHFSLAFYSAYGFGDKEWKYGSELNLKLYKKRDLNLAFSYKNDLIESGGYSFAEKLNQNSTEVYRKYLIKDMTYEQNYTIKLHFLATKKLQINLSAQKLKNTISKENTYLFSPTSLSSIPNYSFAETNLQLRYAPKEQKAYIDNEYVALENYTSPIFLVNVIKSYPLYGGNFDYFKTEAKLNLSFLTKALGKTNLQFTTAKIWGDAPYFKLYNGHESYSNFSIEAANSFTTMRMGEFLSSEFFTVYFRQDFGSLLLKTSKFKPKIVLVNNFTIGKLSNANFHSNISFKTLEKGYFESGIIANNLIQQFKIIGYGFGVFYRYGYYKFEKTRDNFAFRFSITFDL